MLLIGRRLGSRGGRLQRVHTLHVALQVGHVIKGLAALVAHDVLGLEVDLVDVLAKVRVLSLALRTLGLPRENY